MTSPYLTLEEAAAYTRYSPKTIKNRRREIPAVGRGGKLLFTRETLDRWLAGQTTRRRGRPRASATPQPAA